ncbi:MAG: acetate kinase [Candidatus Riflebacteria bacterium]|nr:acetate kinase [Candidatus Riflebacteria bacterium]
MNILVLNCGSSSIKYQLFNMKDQSILAKGLVNRVGMANACIDHISGRGPKIQIITDVIDHHDGIKKVFDLLVSKDHGVIGSLDEINAVGHRVVHAGEKFAGSVLLTDDVLEALRECIIFAPLHNPPNLRGIEAVSEYLPKVKQAGVFDTAFHQTMPIKAFLYALPKVFYDKDRIRRYGFHGTSHRFVSKRAAILLKKPYETLKIISIHLGNGCSMAAIDCGKSVDTSMGHTPVEGLVMGTRVGDIDPAIVLHIMKKYELAIHEVDNLLNKHSGVLGISGESNDLRDLEEGWPNRSPKANLALEVYSYRIRKYIGAYMAVMNGCDAIVFTAGVGENSSIVRDLVCQNLDFLGIRIDTSLNKKTVRGAEGDISTSDARVRTLVIPTNEELVIAEDTLELIEGRLDPKTGKPAK